jgi:hypothetical protein
MSCECELMIHSLACRELGWRSFGVLLDFWMRVLQRQAVLCGFLPSSEWVRTTSFEKEMVGCQSGIKL